MKPLVINLFAEPGAGKSTLAAGLFYELKMRGINCELVREYAKDKVWEESFATLEDQIYVFGKQLHRTNVVADKVDVIITDSPVLLSMYYAKDISKEFKDLILSEFHSFNNVNYFVTRKKPYNPAGRMQTEEEAKDVRVKLRKLLNDNNVNLIEVDGSKEGLGIILEDVLGKLGDGQ